MPQQEHTISVPSSEFPIAGNVLVRATVEEFPFDRCGPAEEENDDDMW